MGQRRQRHKRLMSRSEWPSFVLLFSFLSFWKNHNRESTAVFVWLLIIQADGKSMSSACPPPPSHPHAPLLPPSQIQARCQRENKQNTEEEKQKAVDGFTASLIKRLFTSEEEEAVGCQAAVGRRWGGEQRVGVGLPGGCHWLPKKHQSKSMV